MRMIEWSQTSRPKKNPGPKINPQRNSMPILWPLKVPERGNAITQRKILEIEHLCLFIHHIIWIYPFPHLAVILTMLEQVLETPKNGFVSTVTLWITLNKPNPGKNITNNLTKLITNIKNNNHALINYDASIETLSTAYIPMSFLGNYTGYIN